LVTIVMGFSTNGNGGLQLPIAGGGLLPPLTWTFQALTFDGVVWDLSNALSVEVGGF
jgi:hypothetical protein